MPEYASRGGVPHARGGFLHAGGGLLARPPPVNRMTNRCKNITLAKTSFRPVMMGDCESTPTKVNISNFRNVTEAQLIHVTMSRFL